MKSILESSLFMLLMLLSFNNISANKSSDFATVCVPIADIRVPNPMAKRPLPYILTQNIPRGSIFPAGNAQQKTQVLFGETLKIIKEDDDWAFVQIPSQRCFNAFHQYLPIDGWISKRAIIKKIPSNKPNLIVKTAWAPIHKTTNQVDETFFVSMGTRLNGHKNLDGSWDLDLINGSGKIGNEYVENINNQPISISNLRTKFIDNAKLLLSGAYIWGGGSAPAELYPGQIPNNLAYQVMGIDCSGFVYIVLKTLCLQCPRNSNDQYLLSVKLNKKNEPLSGKDLKQGDLIFFAKVAKDGKTPLRIEHVAIYLGQNKEGESLIIEAQGITNPYGVRIISTKNFSRLGFKNVSEIKLGDIYDYYDDVLKLKLKSYIVFGTFFRPEKLQAMRKDFQDSAMTQLISPLA